MSIVFGRSGMCASVHFVAVCLRLFLDFFVVNAYGYV